MSLGDPLVLKDSSGTDHNFDLQSQAILKDGTVKSTRVDRASSPSEPVTLIIKQSVTGRGPNRVRRFLVQFTIDKISPTTGLLSRYTQNLSVVYPLNGDVTATNTYDGLAWLGDLVGGTVTVDTTKVGYLLQGQS